MDAISSAAFTFSRLDTTKTNNTFITQLLEISYAPSNYSGVTKISTICSYVAQFCF